LVAIARRCFGAAGSTDVAMEDIAAAAGIARSTLYVYFPSRSDLLHAATAAMYAEFDEELRGATPAPTAIEQLRTLIAALVTVVDRDRKFFRLLLGAEQLASVEGAAIGAALASIALAINAETVAILERGVSERCFAPSAPNQADLVGQQLLGALAVRSSEPQLVDHQVFVDRIVTFLTHALT
jgi:TetR/AcrR family fatty acid metabolism transcriptional regulator